MSSGDERAGEENHLTGWSETVDRLESANPAILAFHAEPDLRGRLAGDSPPDGPLRGVPVGVKDLFRVDGLPTTAGSSLPPELFEGEQSWIVSLLRGAGATVLGKTAMDEFAFCEPPATRNPRDLTRTPGGSSGGSAAAVAAGMCPLALGSQTLHSTIGPAAYCGVVGFKPSFGRWPFDGVGLAPSFDTIGYLADGIETLTRAAAVLPGWRLTETSKPILGVPRAWGVRRLHTEGWTAFAGHVEVLRAAGFETRTSRVPWSDDSIGWASVIGDLVCAEFAEAHRPWFDRYRHLYRPLTADAVERGRAVPHDRLAQCAKRRTALVDELHTVTEESGIDCWICPAAGGVAPLHSDTGRDTWMTCFWSMAGWPAVNIPIFDGDGGLPHGLQIVAARGHDEHVLLWATTIQSALSDDGADGGQRGAAPI